MKPQFLLFTWLIFATIYCAAQDNSSGVFLAMKASNSTAGYSKIVVPRDGTKEFNVPLDPVISPTEFFKVSEIVTDPVLRSTYFSLTFTQKGMNNLRAVFSKVKGTQLLLVVDNVVIGYVETLPSGTNRSIQIGGDFNSTDIYWAHERLSKIISDKGASIQK